MDLREFLREVERKWPDQILRIDTEIDPRYEITAIVTALEKKRLTPVVICERVKGSEFPVVVNVTGTRDRVAAAIGSSARSATSDYLARLNTPWPPVEVETGPVKDVVLNSRDADLLKLPQIVHHQNDGGPYIAFGMAIAKDPDTGVYNASFNRFQIKGSQRLGINMTPGRHLREFYMRAKDRGQPLEVAIVIGTHPALSQGGVYVGPMEVDELAVMGALLGKPVELVRCETIDVLVPAHAEMVIEGVVPPDVLEPEGPFGEFTGYSLGVRDREVFDVKAITHRRDAMFQDISPGRPELFFLSSVAQEACLHRIIAAMVPNLKGIHIPAPFTLYMSLRQRAEGQAKNAIFAALASEFYMKTVVVVDDDIDVHDYRQVLWAMGTRVQADRDVFVVPNALGAELDPSCTRDGVTAKMGIDATAKPSLRAYPPRNRVPSEVTEKIEKSGLF